MTFILNLSPEGGLFAAYCLKHYWLINVSFLCLTILIWFLDIVIIFIALIFDKFLFAYLIYLVILLSYQFDLIYPKAKNSNLNFLGLYSLVFIEFLQVFLSIKFIFYSINQVGIFSFEPQFLIYQVFRLHSNIKLPKLQLKTYLIFFQA